MNSYTLENLKPLTCIHNNNSRVCYAALQPFLLKLEREQELSQERQLPQRPLMCATNEQHNNTKDNTKVAAQQHVATNEQTNTYG